MFFPLQLCRNLKALAATKSLSLSLLGAIEMVRKFYIEREKKKEIIII
jgi:hypothetical protein